MVEKIPAMLDATFECTVQMISRDFQDFPEHRAGFFRFIRNINAYCFAGLVCSSPFPSLHLWLFGAKHSTDLRTTKQR